MVRPHGLVIGCGVCRLAALFSLVAVLSCAKQAFPPGGPVDETPPEIVMTSPAPGATNVSSTDPLLFEFSEPMDDESVEENFFIVPIPGDWPSFEWRQGGRVFVVRLNRELEPDVTYVISIGAKARDRNRNSLEESYMLTFSTGTVLEDKRIAGRIVPGGFLGPDPEEVALVDVIAYRIEETMESPDPRNDIPDYLTQTGTDGYYELIGLSSGKYRLFAIGDNDRDGYYTENYDMIGIAPHDVTLTAEDSLTTAPDITVAMRYTTEFQLTSARAPDNRRLELFFDRSVEPETLRLDIPGLEVNGWFPIPGNRRAISVVTGPQANGRRYEIARIEAEDRDGNGIMPLDVVPFFDGTSRPDTTSLAIVEQQPPVITRSGEPVALVFNRALAVPEGLSGIFSEDSRLSLAIEQTAPNRIVLKPVESWQPGVSYDLLFDRDRLTGIAGNRLPADGARVEIRVAPADSLSALGGIVDVADQTGSCRIIAREIVTGESREVTADEEGTWHSGSLLPGRYLIWGHHDSDGDGRVNPGTVAPYLFAEQVAAYPDTVDLAPRWPVTDIRIRFE